MREDSISVQKHTPEKPEVLAMASRLAVDPDKVFACCFRVWRWAHTNTTDGVLPGLTQEAVDKQAGLDGFAFALAAVGWLAIEIGALRIPHFERHMRKRKPAEKKTKLPPPDPTEGDYGFADFWAAYPNHKGRAAALRAWMALRPNADGRKGIMAALAWQRTTLDWTKENGRFIPHASTWINGRRWEDEPPAATVGLPKPPKTDDDRRRMTLEIRRKAEEEAAKAVTTEEQRARIAELAGKRPKTEQADG